MSAIGTCSICGGHVTVPGMWGGVGPPPATCERCGATPRKDALIPRLPEIPMEPARPLSPWVRR